jgi:hypothetical protein
MAELKWSMDNVCRQCLLTEHYTSRPPSVSMRYLSKKQQRKELTLKGASRYQTGSPFLLKGLTFK